MGSKRNVTMLPLHPKRRMGGGPEIDVLTARYGSDPTDAAQRRRAAGGSVIWCNRGVDLLGRAQITLLFFSLCACSLCACSLCACSGEVIVGGAAASAGSSSTSGAGGTGSTTTGSGGGTTTGTGGPECPGGCTELA